MPAANSTGLRELLTTFGRSALRVVELFLVAYVLYIDAVNTIIKMAVDYGVSLGLDQAAC